MPSMSKAEIDEFLREPRIGVLCTNDLDGSPNGVPVWFEWDGERIRMFSSASHKKIARLENDGGRTTKKKLPIRVDRGLALRAELHARARGVSLSSLVESALREVVEETRPSFASRWRGKFKVASRDGRRYAALARRHV